MTDPEQIDELNTGLLLYIPYRAMDFTPAQARVFQRIAPGGSRLTDLAEQASITKQSAGFLVDQLERAGYVDRIPDPSDARARLIRITERGRQTLPLAATVVTEVETEWTEHIGKRRMDSSARYWPGCVRSPTPTPNPHVDTGSCSSDTPSLWGVDGLDRDQDGAEVATRFKGIVIDNTWDFQ